MCERLGRDFEAGTGIHVVYSFGATGNLTRQIENGAPFDLFAAADTEHLIDLEREGFLVPGSRAVYARGRLVLWSPAGSKVHLESVQDLASDAVRVVAVAQPSIAPYGMAAVETLQSLGIWERVRPKVVYAESIGMAKQFAATGNAEACFTAYSLVLGDGGRVVDVPEELHQPIEQSLGILKRSRAPGLAGRYRDFVLGPQGSAIFEQYGYSKK